MYRHLDPGKLQQTIHLFRQRVARVFPKSGLAEVSAEVEAATSHCISEVEQLGKPHWKLRILAGLGALLIVLVPLEMFFLAGIRAREFESLSEFVQVSDAGFNMLVLLGGAVLFFMTFEERIKRRRALRALHELRSLAHVIDMHQLSKDPGMKLSVLDGPRDRERDPAIQSEAHLWFYLSFCTDLLAVVGKAAALFGDGQSDRVVLDTVNEIETLSTSLSRKIWQKMSLVKPAALVAVNNAETFV
jgi:hypothetical protein